MKKISLIVLIPVLLACACQKGAHTHSHEKEHDHDHAEKNHHEAGHEQGKEHSDEKNHDHEEASHVGPGFAVVKADHENGLQLSDVALKTIGVKTMPVEGNTVTLPKNSLVREKTRTGFYRLRGGWFKMILIETGIFYASGAAQTITSPELKAGDHVVIEGGGLLRIAELDVFTEDVEGHHH